MTWTILVVRHNVVIWNLQTYNYQSLVRKSSKYTIDLENNLWLQIRVSKKKVELLVQTFFWSVLQLWNMKYPPHPGGMERGGGGDSYPYFEKWGRGKSMFLLHHCFGKNLRRNWIFSMEAKQYCPLDQAVEIFCFAWQFWKLAPPHTHTFSYQLKVAPPFRSILKPAPPTVHSSTTTLLLFSLWFDHWDNNVLT